MICAQLMLPKQAKHDWEVYDEVIKWEDSYRDAVSRGMEVFIERQKKVVLFGISTDTLRELITNRNAQEESELDFMSYRNFVMQWAVTKKSQHKKPETPIDTKSDGKIQGSMSHLLTGTQQGSGLREEPLV